MCFKRCRTCNFSDFSKNDLDKIKSIVKETWEDMNVKVNIMTLPVEPQGAQIVSE